MTKPLAGSCVVIAAGRGSEVAADIANAFAAADAHVVCAVSDDDARSPALDTINATIGAARMVAFAEPSAVQAFAGAMLSEHSSLDVWVNHFPALASGVGADALQPSQWAQTMESTISATFWCCQAAGRAMLGRGGGVIVNVLSPDAYVASSGSVAVSVAMAGIVMVTKTLAVEWAGGGVRVVGAAGLGPVAAAPERRVPLKRRGLGPELAEAILFLAGPDADYITGEVLPVDGGWASYRLF